MAEVTSETGPKGIVINEEWGAPKVSKQKTQGLLSGTTRGPL